MQPTRLFPYDETMKQPPFLPPQRPRRFRFGLNTLLLLVTCVGPLVLVAAALPRDFYNSQGRFTLEVVCVAGLAWCASFVRPIPLAIYFWFLIVISAVLGILLFVGRSTDYEMLCAATGVSVRATLTAGLAVGLSWSRHAR